jgi:hypothetical protein
MEEEGKDEILKERVKKEEKIGGQIVLGNFYRGTVVAGNFGLKG